MIAIDSDFRVAPPLSPTYYESMGENNHDHLPLKNCCRHRRRKIWTCPCRPRRTWTQGRCGIRVRRRIRRRILVLACGRNEQPSQLRPPPAASVLAGGDFQECCAIVVALAGRGPIHSAAIEGTPVGGLLRFGKAGADEVPDAIFFDRSPPQKFSHSQRLGQLE